jgi:hypothetical protein
VKYQKQVMEMILYDSSESVCYSEEEMCNGEDERQGLFRSCLKALDMFVTFSRLLFIANCFESVRNCERKPYHGQDEYISPLFPLSMASTMVATFHASLTYLIS